MVASPLQLSSQKLIAQMPDPAFVNDGDGRVVAWNQGMVELTGIREKDILGRDYTVYAPAFYGEATPLLIDLLTCPDSPVLERYCQLVRGNGSLSGQSYASRLYEGKGTTVWARASLLFNDKEEAVGAMEIIRDLSDWAGKVAEKQAMNEQLGAALRQFRIEVEQLRGQYEQLQCEEKRIRESERRFRNLLGNVPLVVLVMDDEGRIDFINDHGLKFIGLSREEMAGRWNRYSQLAYEHLQMQLRTGESASYELPVPDPQGSTRYFHINSAAIWEKGRIIGSMVVGYDITEEKRAAQALKDSEAALRRTADNMLDLISQLDSRGNLVYASPSHYSVLGYHPEEMKKVTLTHLVHPDDLPSTSYALKMVLHNGVALRSIQRARHANGSYMWMETVANPLLEGEQVTGVILSSRDITERKKLEDELRYLSLHDSLTGLYNRTYFEEEMDRLDNRRYDPVGVMICDLDGLKLINDTLGHEAGDRLLVSTANVLGRCFRHGDVISRVGGDEFAILLPRSERSILEQVSARVYAAVQEYNQENPELPLSLSIGMAVRSSSATSSLRDIFKEADNEMYRVKLQHSQSARSAVIQTLTRALETRDFINQGHAERIQDLTARLGRRLSLAESTLATLQLLARFHDIGKVGVPNRILFKRGPLAPVEYSEMQRHCEIGYRIALASPELASLADLILKHHEWWNGRGYPLGLSGVEIPLECRILALIDAYDAMTSDRPYRPAMSAEAARQEIHNKAGEQFDPWLVRNFIDMLAEEEPVN